MHRRGEFASVADTVDSLTGGRARKCHQLPTRRSDQAQKKKNIEQREDKITYTCKLVLARLKRACKVLKVINRSIVKKENFGSSDS